MAEVDGRELAEGDLALGRVLDRRVEDLAAGHVDVPVVDGPRRPASESVRSVRSPTIRTSSAASNTAAIARHPPRLGVPVEQDGAEDELLVLRRVVIPASWAAAFVGYSQITHGTSIAIWRRRSGSIALLEQPAPLL